MLLFWICAAVATIVMELVTPTALVSIWFACGAVVACLFEMAGAGLELQICGNIIATNADRMIHEVGLVTKDITAESWGEVKIKGTLWSAVSIDSSVIPAGSKVKIMAIEGAKLIVREINEG